ncbi:hypothetical protein A2U01_0077162, partial [Trifolium medium]|nr:hypothetical protein [Trifolium medium]
QPQLRVAQTPEENLPLYHCTARRASPSCAPRQRQKAKPPSQHELHVAQHAFARRARYRKWGICGCLSL